MAQPLAPSPSRRPYLLRALHEWMTDNNQTPHIVVDAGMQGVEVPRQFVQDGKIVLNVSYSAAQGLGMTNHEITFNARFGGHSYHVVIPVLSVIGIYARETGQGMIFGDEYVSPTPPPTTSPDSPPPASSPTSDGPDEKSARRAKFKVVK
jgi:stringent starvation protein B